MKKITLLAVTSLILLGACVPKEGIEVRDAWARTALPGENGAVYLTLHNYNAMDDSLTGVTADVAESAELHKSMLNHDVMEMNMLASVPLAPGETVEFAPGGLHIMLVNLAQELKIGEIIEITLHFEKSADLPVSVHVKAGPEHDDD